MALLSRGDIPLSQDPSARYLPWLLGIMCYFAVLASVGAMTSHQLAARWDFALGSVVTVQIPPKTDEASDAALAAGGAHDAPVAGTPSARSGRYVAQRRASGTLARR